MIWLQSLAQNCAICPSKLEGGWRGGGEIGDLALSALCHCTTLRWSNQGCRLPKGLAALIVSATQHMRTHTHTPHHTPPHPSQINRHVNGETRNLIPAISYTRAHTHTHLKNIILQLFPHLTFRSISDPSLRLTPGYQLEDFTSLCSGIY